MKETTKPDIDVDWEELLRDKPDEEKYHNFYLEESDMRMIIRALLGQEPIDAVEAENRRRMVNGLVYQMTGKQEES